MNNYQPNKRTIRLICVSLTLLLPGCGNKHQNIAFNNAISNANKKLEASGKTFGGAIFAGNEPALDKAFESMKKMVGEVRAEMKALKVPESKNAKELYDEHQRFLDIEEKMIQGDFAQIVKVMKDKALDKAAKNEKVTSILQRLGQTENEALAKLQKAQQAFATANHFRIQ